MFCVTLDAPDDFDGWRNAARNLALSKVPAQEVSWHVGASSGDLFGGAPLPHVDPSASFAVPQPFVDLAQSAILHSDPERFALLYALLLHVRARPGVVQDRADPLLRRVEREAVGPPRPAALSFSAAVFDFAGALIPPDIRCDNRTVHPRDR